MNRQIAVIAGPTAVGKTKFAIEAARALDGEIISCDSMQLYRYMDIGSAKPTPEEMAQAVHHLVDVIDPSQPFSAAMYQKMAKEAIEEVFSRGKLPIISGGTGLYLNTLIYDMDFSGADRDDRLRLELEEEARANGPEALHRRLEELDQDAAERIHPNNVKRVRRALEGALTGHNIRDFRECISKCKDYDINLIILSRNREELYDRINKRVDILVQEGLFEEVDCLMSKGLTEDDISMKGIGYKEIIGYFHGNYDKDEAIDLIKKNTRHFAKRQITWFKRYKEAKWLNISSYTNDEQAAEVMIQWLRNR